MWLAICESDSLELVRQGQFECTFIRKHGQSNMTALSNLTNQAPMSLFILMETCTERSNTS
jgi:hypothetical protein